MLTVLSALSDGSRPAQALSCCSRLNFIRSDTSHRHSPGSCYPAVSPRPRWSERGMELLSSGALFSLLRDLVAGKKSSDSGQRRRFVLLATVGAPSVHIARLLNAVDLLQGIAAAIPVAMSLSFWWLTLRDLVTVLDLHLLWHDGEFEACGL
ncbi:hypothetical protein K438DRAFT_1955327 [Mycena galopus ATCC 62051]|nr:hypothetical protein K438DRAFT_1955327 [Mycena galopus ATCC 62051]